MRTDLHYTLIIYTLRERENILTGVSELLCLYIVNQHFLRHDNKFVSFTWLVCFYKIYSCAHTAISFFVAM